MKNPWISRGTARRQANRTGVAFFLLYIDGEPWSPGSVDTVRWNAHMNRLIMTSDHSDVVNFVGSLHYTFTYHYQIQLEVKVKGSVVEHWTLPDTNIPKFNLFVNKCVSCEFEVESWGLQGIKSRFF